MDRLDRGAPLKFKLHRTIPLACVFEVANVPGEDASRGRSTGSLDVHRIGDRFLLKASIVTLPALTKDR